MTLAAVDPWRWQPHPEVWLLVVSVLALGIYVSRVIAPKVHGAAVTGSQRRWFVLGLAVLWVASDWPMHDIAEESLYSVHMVQHLLLTLVLPPIFLLATPEWLARLFIGSDAGPWVRRLTRPLVAALVFNVLVALTHWSALVNLSVENGPVHYVLHTVIVVAAFAMWVPIAGPVPELRMSLPGQMIYLFVMSVLPTIPGGWLTFAEGVVYDAYDGPERLFGISVITDQQAAGMIMKVVGGAYLWTLITMLFFRWAGREMLPDESTPEPAEPPDPLVGAGVDAPLTFDDVAGRFAGSPAPPEPARD